MSHFKVLIISLAVVFVLFCGALGYVKVYGKSDETFFNVIITELSSKKIESDSEIAHHIATTISNQYGVYVTIDSVKYYKERHDFGGLASEGSTLHEHYAFKGKIKDNGMEFSGECWPDYTNLFSAELMMVDRHDIR